MSLILPPGLGHNERWGFRANKGACLNFSTFLALAFGNVVLNINNE